MSALNNPLRDSDFHAYADGVLAPGRRAEVIAFLAAHPDETERVLGWQRQNELLRAAFPAAGPQAAERLARRAPDNLVPLARAAGKSNGGAAAPGTSEARARRRSASAYVSAAALLVAGAAILFSAIAFSGGAAGLFDRFSPVDAVGAGAAPAAAALPDGLARRALEAHAVFAEDRDAPVEFEGAVAAQLLAYLSRRTGAAVQAPNLTAQGLRLLGGRVLPLADGTAAMLVYDGGAGRRVALTVARIGAAGDVGKRFQQAESGAVHSARWMAGDELYVLTSQASRHDTLGLATAASAAIDAARGPDGGKAPNPEQ